MFVVGMVLATVLTVLGTFYFLKNYILLHDSRDPLVKQGGLMGRSRAVECQDAARNVSMPRNRFERPDVAGREKSAFAERYLRIDSLPGLHKIAFHQRLKRQNVR